VVGRSELTEHVWDERYDPYSNVIDATSTTSGEKSHHNSDQPLIHTRRGSGYILSTVAPAIEPE